jgi:hypothetical protein
VAFEVAKKVTGDCRDDAFLRWSQNGRVSARDQIPVWWFTYKKPITHGDFPEFTRWFSKLVHNLVKISYDKLH